MEEAIFQGSLNRRPVNRGSVTLVMSNEDRVLPVPYDEVEPGLPAVAFSASTKYGALARPPGSSISKIRLPEVPANRYGLLVGILMLKAAGPEVTALRAGSVRLPEKTLVIENARFEAKVVDMLPGATDVEPRVRLTFL